MQPCVTKPVLLESVCSMRPGHMGFLPTSSRPSSPFLEYTPWPAGETNEINRRDRLTEMQALYKVEYITNTEEHFRERKLANIVLRASLCLQIEAVYTDQLSL